MYICTPSQMKQAEALADKNGVSYLRLMENAGIACTQQLQSRIAPLDGMTALILCGRGNNGGDGFVIARLLAQKGVCVTVLLVADRKSVTGIARENLDRLNDMTQVTVTDSEDSAGCDYSIIVDAVFGTGFHGELPERVRKIFSRCAASSAFKIAVDIPSGADSVTGSADTGTLECDLTVTLGAVKTGLLMSPADKLCGELVCADIGIDNRFFDNISAPLLADMSTVRSVLPERSCHSHKGKFGKLLIVGGCSTMSGAASLNVKGALRSGAGIVTLASTPRVIDRVGSMVSECTFTELKENSSGGISADSIPMLTQKAKDYTVIAAGSGLSCCDDSKKIITALIKLCGENDIPLILDADGLNCVSGSIDIIKNANCRAVLTPHPKELSRLLGIPLCDVMADRLGCARKLSELTGAITAAKGMPTYITSPDGRSYASFTGNGGLSRGGSGDVLTGIVGGMLASCGGNAADITAAAVYIFGLAADITADKLSQTGMLPSDVTAQLPFAFKKCERTDINEENLLYGCNYSFEHTDSDRL